MADIPFVRKDYKTEGDVYLAETVTDVNAATSRLTLNEGQNDITVQIIGTVAGATVVVQGSLDGTNFNTLNDRNGNAMSYTAIGIIRSIRTACIALKVSTSGGGGTQDIDVLVYIVRKPR